MSELLNIAHRGFSGKYPENTLVAFMKSIDVADMIELDVTLSHDRELVVIHDATLNRTTNGVGQVRNTSWKEIMSLDAGSWFHPDYKQEKIPSLEEVLKLLLDKKIRLNIEIKSEAYDDEFTSDSIENQIVDLINKFQMMSRVVVSSFNKKILERVRNISPTITLAVLVDESEDEYIPLAQKLKAKYINLPLSVVTSEIVSALHSAGFSVLVWTVNQGLDMDRMLAFGVDGMFTNFPDVLRLKILANEKKR